MRKIYLISSYLLIALGAVHSALTPVFYKTFSPDALWYFGIGLSFIFLGIINVSSIRVKICEVINICIGLNAFASLYTIAIAIALMELQAFVAVIILALVTLGSATTKKKFIYV